MTPYEAADAAARQAGVELAELSEVETLEAAASLFAAIWNPGGESPAPLHLLRAVQHAGGYVAGAFAPRGPLVGAAMGFFGQHGTTPLLHSHILGVSPDHQGGNVGFALKLHQRAWALAHDISTIEWTFDPLVRRNAWFNLTKLGAVGVEYLPNFYGAMTDGINRGDASDRLLVSWSLHEPRVEVAAVRRPELLDDAALMSEGATALLVEGGNRAPRPARRRRASVFLCITPQDIVALRAQDPGLARRWRAAVREVLTETFETGYRAVGMTKGGCYVLTREES